MQSGDDMKDKKLFELFTNKHHPSSSYYYNLHQPMLSQIIYYHLYKLAITDILQSPYNSLEISTDIV